MTQDQEMTMGAQVTVGVIGGTGMLGRSLVTGLLASGEVAAEALWVSNRSGRAEGLPDGVLVTAEAQALVAACDVVILSVPPAQFGALEIDASGKLVISVMAGVSAARIAEHTGAERVVRAMSSPAAARRLAFSPWCGALSAEDCAQVIRLLGACGSTAEVPDEAQIEIFTAMTGPVPGFVAQLAASMADYAERRGVAPEVADMAVRQLFLASGEMLAGDPQTASAHVRGMIDYAGTTAAGLLAMQEAGFQDAVDAGLDAAVARTREIAG
ncbi:pyrroline-5-carboxylate reductase family protein [Alloyangia pacifica]|uniref:pyrroline-5-carboxylate reductase family protein n=1 Tax=Alloyangia pacifica TaxID=311180 RepID=UPI001CD5DAEA|nr:pyrroline-5-carboxylate reductase dimerization domain-containing protein [Alloyangia pacifica]MCA0997674.1 NAD(P)-binding domain-containing protein [Alloyangia pacifica]